MIQLRLGVEDEWSDVGRGRLRLKRVQSVSVYR